METKLNYEAPEMEIIPMETEQVLATSGTQSTVNQWGNQGQIDDGVYQ